MLIFILKFAVVMASMIGADFCWAKYFIKVSARRPVQAANWSAMITVCGIITVTGYTGDKFLIPAVLLGGWIGTYLAVRYSKK
jgi:hypothetical protein